MRRPIYLPITLLAVLATATSLLAAEPELASRIDAYAAPFAEAGHLSGTLLVARSGDVLYERSWGLANRATKTAFEPGTLSGIASVTKPTTVILASQLVESGKISLRDPISKWLDNFPSGDAIEFQHLLFHRAGIPHRLTEPDDENRPRTAADMVELARERGLDFEPGSRTSYSSGGFSVMVRVLELASGKSYQELLHEGIVEALGLERTIHPGAGVDLSEAAMSYTWALQAGALGKTVAPDKDYSFLIGAGALFSTPRDLFTIARTLIDGGFGKRPRTQLLRAGRLRWNGITNSYRAFLDYDAATEVMVVLVANQMAGVNDLLRANVPRLVAGEDVDEPEVPQPSLVTLPSETLGRYAGRYQIAGSPMPVRAQNGALYANDWVLLPTSETTFFSPQDYGTISVLGEEDTPRALDWSGMECPRLGPLED